MLSLHYQELMGKIKNMKKKIFDGWRLHTRKGIRQD